MKTFTFIAFAACLSAIFNSCTAESTPADPVENPEQWYTEVLEVKAEDWNFVGPENETDYYDGLDYYFEYIFDDFPYVNGIINIYLYQNFGTAAEVQVPLPYTRDELKISPNGLRKHFSIQYSYDIAVDGTIALKIHLSDYNTQWFSPRTERFRVAIIY
jgi:hypothetical protein